MYFFIMSELILAKTNPPETLQEHIENCLSVFRSIRELFPHIPSICGEPSFFEHLFYAVSLHDVGKVAEGFQKKWEHWGYRHEILSAGFVVFPKGLTELEQRAIALAIITHHKNIKELRERFATTLPVGAEEFQKRRQELESQIDFLQNWVTNLPLLAERYLGYRVSVPNLLSDVSEIIDAYKFAVRWYITAWEDNETTTLHST